MKLIINGDDLGYTRGNSNGIFQAYRDGILRSTSVLTNSRYFETVMKMAEELPGLGTGVHMTLTLGKPLTANRTLTDPETGEFWRGSKTAVAKDPVYEEIYTEWKAQIERYIETAGHLPTHLDSHHHVHTIIPAAQAAALRLSEEYGLPLRGYCSYKFVSGFYGPTATKDTLFRLLEEHKDHNIELMCHPGWCDLELYRKSSYALERVRELDILCSSDVKEYIENNGIELCHY